MNVPFNEVLFRMKKSPIVDEKSFDLSIYAKTQALQKKYKIKYDPNHPLDIQGGMADRIYQAGLRLFLDIGTYCTNTHRVIKFTEQELMAQIAACPDQVVLGQGNDAVMMLHREVAGNQEPVVIAGIQTIPFSDEEIMFKIYKACALDLCVDGIWGGLLLKIDGKYDVIAGTPSEIYQYRKTVEILRKAIKAAGRPGMVTINNAPTSAATIAMYDEEVGLRRSDYIITTGMSELKVTYDDLNRSAYGLAHGVPIHGAHNAVIGGFSGNPEGAAICAVAGVFQLVMVHKADILRCGVVDYRLKSRQSRSQIWAAGTATQAISRNTKLIVEGSIGDHPAAGPGTKQYFYESAAGHIVSTIMGGHSTDGTRKFNVGNTPNFGTPLESRWMGEICKGAISMDLERADRIVKHLITAYEDHLENAPEGQPFEKLYDHEKMTPLNHYKDLYHDVKKELIKLGFHFRNYESVEA